MSTQETYHATQSFLSNGSSELINEDVDASGSRVRQAIEHIQSKISKTRELIKTEQTTRDGNLFFLTEIQITMSEVTERKRN